MAYRAGGLLKEVKHVVTVRSRLKETILDTLHTNGIEIVSPTFMSTRFYPETRRFIAKDLSGHPEPTTPEVRAEEIAFDKAEEAASLEELKTKQEELTDRLSELEHQLKSASTDEESGRLTRQIRQLTDTLDRTKQRIDEKEAEAE